MGLRLFHLFFVTLSVILTAFFAAWAVGEYRLQHEVLYAIGCVLSLATGVALTIYGARFQRKTRNL